MIQSYKLLFVYHVLALNLLTANSWANWCAWSSTTCEKFMSICVLRKHRVCACPEPSENGKTTKKEFCYSPRYLPDWQRKGFTVIEDSSSKIDSSLTKCKKKIITSASCGDSQNPATPPWCGWSVWSQWSHKCGDGSRLRQRICDCAEVSTTRILCNGKYWETDYQNRNKKCRVPLWCPWSSWTRTCNCFTFGSSKRTRACNCPYVRNVRCKGSSMQICQKPRNCDRLRTTVSTSQLWHPIPKETDDQDNSSMSGTTVVYILIAVGVTCAMISYLVFKQRKMRNRNHNRGRTMVPISPPLPPRQDHPETIANQPSVESTNEASSLSTNTSILPPSYDAATANPGYHVRPQYERPPSYDSVMEHQEEYRMK